MQNKTKQDIEDLQQIVSDNSSAIGQMQTDITNIDVSWNAITGKPTTFAPSTHSHDIQYLIKDPDGSAVFLNGIDLNNAITTGLYRGTGCSNQPPLTQGWFYMIVMGHGSAWVYQECIDLHDSSKRYIRHMYSGAWTAWTDPFQSVVNGKQSVVNAINGSLGYASGLTTSHTHDDYAWWIQNKVYRRYQERAEAYMYNIVSSNVSGAGASATISIKLTPLVTYTSTGIQQYTIYSSGTYIVQDGRGDNSIRSTVIAGAATIKKYSVADIIYVTTVPCTLNINVMATNGYVYRMLFD